MITFTETARQRFEQERLRQGRPDLGVRISFLYGCGGAGFRVAFTDELADAQVLQHVDGIRIGLDKASQEVLQDAVVDWGEGPDAGFILRHPDAALVEFC